MKLECEVELSIDVLASGFWSLDDDAQSRFFCAVAELARKSCEDSKTATPDFQWYAIGRHLRTCECSTSDGRNMIQCIADAMEPIQLDATSEENRAE